MPIKYSYAQRLFDTKADATANIAVFKALLDNEPTRWMAAKEITGSAEDGWVMASQTLTNAELLNPDETKTYMCYSFENGTNVMPLTAAELSEKRDQFRAAYAGVKKADIMIEVNTDTGIETELSISEDMSGYM
jgi:hypothetical protein